MLDALKKNGLQYVPKNIFPSLYGKKVSSRYMEKCCTGRCNSNMLDEY
jgi:hypothetical protein